MVTYFDLAIVIISSSMMSWFLFDFGDVVHNHLYPPPNFNVMPR